MPAGAKLRSLFGEEGERVGGVVLYLRSPSPPHCKTVAAAMKDRIVFLSVRRNRGFS